MINCTACPLHEGRPMVCGNGGAGASVMIVDEAPGAEEQRALMPFAGDSRKILERALRKVGLDWNDVYVTYVVKHQTPRGRPPYKKEINACSLILETEIEALEPKVIIPLGSLATTVLTGVKGITDTRGRVLSSLPEFGELPTVPTYRPTSMLRDASLWDVFVADIDKALSVVDGTYDPTPTETVVLSQPGEVIEFLESIEGGLVGCDIETSSLSHIDGHVLCLSFSVERAKAVVVPLWDYDGTESPVLALNPRVDAALRHFFVESDSRVIWHNGQFDNKFLMRWWDLDTPPKTWRYDTLLMHHLLNENIPQGLEYLASLYLSMPGWKHKLDAYMKEVHGKQVSYSMIPGEVLWPYAGMDADATLRLFHKFEPRLRAEGELWRLFEEQSLPTAKVFARMEDHGMPIDVEEIHRLRARFEINAEKAFSKVVAVVGEEFNPRSPKQVASILYEKMRFREVSKKTGSGQPSTNEATLKLLADPKTRAKGWGNQPLACQNVRPEHRDFPKLLLEYRKIHKLLSTYLGDSPRGLLQNVDADARIRCSIQLHGTRTGRAAASSPNLMNIPGRAGIREVFKAPPGYKFIEADYSQAELRLVAWLAGETSMIEAYERGEDIHTATAAGIYGIPLDQVTDKQRSVGKTINFAVLYGASAFRVSRELEIEEKQADILIRKFFKARPHLARWINQQKQHGLEEGWVETIYGRRRHLPPGFTDAAREHIAREAPNAPVQGGVAGALWAGLVELDRLLHEDGVESRLLLPVHDAILLMCREEDVELVKAYVGACLGQPLPRIGLSLPVDFEVHDSWRSKTE